MQKLLILSLAIITLTLPTIALAYSEEEILSNFFSLLFQEPNHHQSEPEDINWERIFTRIIILTIAFIVGWFFGVINAHKYEEERKISLYFILIIFLIFATFGTSGLSDISIVILCFIILVMGFRIGKGKKEEEKSIILGSAEWADALHVRKQELCQEKGLFLGKFPIKKGKDLTLRYNGSRHLLTIAPTRGGKGVSAIIPNLLTYEGSTIVIDPKGENALITAKQRQKMEHSTMIVDPWNIASSKLDMQPACFNPLDWLDLKDDDFTENAMTLVDALVVTHNNVSDPFWNEEAKALIFGFVLYVASEKSEQKNRNLGRVRDILTMPYFEDISPQDDKSGTLNEILEQMFQSDIPAVVSSASRFLSKSEKERGSVISSAQSHTHFLDSPRIRESLSRSSFDFADLKTKKLTIYLVLPADRLNTYGRWLRLLIQQAITVNARNIEKKPEHPILFLLDEMPALGRLAMIEQAYGLMAGFGMQIWGIIQDTSQLKKIYGESWETFVSNSGVLQYFGSRDSMTADYFSRLCGLTTVWSIGETINYAAKAVFDKSGNTSTNKTLAQRSLATADELMTLKQDRQLLLIENSNPIKAIKVKWFEDDSLKALGNNLHPVKKPSFQEGMSKKIHKVLDNI